MISIGQRIKECRELLKMTQESLANKIGTTKQTIYKYENDIITNIPSDKIELIAKTLGTSPSYLMGWITNDGELIADYYYDTIQYLLNFLREQGYTPIETNTASYEILDENEQVITTISEEDLVRNYEHIKILKVKLTVHRLLKLEEHTEQSPTTKPKAIKIPVLGMVHAGYPVDAIEDVLDWEEVTPEMSARGDLMALQVKGDCMEPRFAEGDVVIVLCQNTAESGDIVIVMVNHDEAEMKKLKRFENGCINLVPLNAAYPVKSFSPQEIEELPIRILGKVIELRAKF